MQTAAACSALDELPRPQSLAVWRQLLDVPDRARAEGWESLADQREYLAAAARQLGVRLTDQEASVILRTQTTRESR